MSEAAHAARALQGARHLHHARPQPLQVRSRPLLDLLLQVWPDARFAVQTKHEGSFYPWQDVVAVVDSLEQQPTAAKTLFQLPLPVEESVFQIWSANFGQDVPFEHGNLMMPTQRNRIDVRHFIRTEPNMTACVEHVCRQSDLNFDVRWGQTGWGLK